jgi:hypothetical protein
MIVMTVGQNSRVNPVNFDAEVPVLPVRLCPGTLEGAAVDEVGTTVYFNNVLGTGNLLGGAEGIEGDTHS